ESTIGGVVAGNVSGPRRIQAGACRDSLIGVRFVDGRGDIVKNGGRVMKNVTGYDLVKLLAGSWGTLGVITEVSLKVLPAPEASATVLISGLDDVTAVAAMSAALGSPFDVTGAAHLPGQATMVRVEGFASSVTYRAERLRDLLAGFGAVEIDEGADWVGIRDVAPFSGRDGAVWRVSVKPSDGPGVAEVARSCGGEAFFDWGGGLVWLLMPEEGEAGGGVIRDAVAKVGGYATLVRAAIRANAFAPETGVAGMLVGRLRSEFDPKGILNPGIMY
ncbi:MAG: FAD-binding protein, partial [Pikeienuella sp.]